MSTEHLRSGRGAKLGRLILGDPQFLIPLAVLTGACSLFLTFFTLGELAMMTALAFAYLDGPGAPLQQLSLARGVLRRGASW